MIYVAFGQKIILIYQDLAKQQRNNWIKDLRSKPLRTARIVRSKYRPSWTPEEETFYWYRYLPVTMTPGFLIQEIRYTTTLFGIKCTLVGVWRGVVYYFWQFRLPPIPSFELFIWTVRLHAKTAPLYRYGISWVAYNRYSRKSATPGVAGEHSSIWWFAKWMSYSDNKMTLLNHLRVKPNDLACTYKFPRKTNSLQQ